jgi:hypothetical protein
MLLNASPCVMGRKMGKVVTLFANAIFVQVLNHSIVDV